MKEYVLFFITTDDTFCMIQASSIDKLNKKLAKSGKFCHDNFDDPTQWELYINDGTRLKATPNVYLEFMPTFVEH